MRAEGPQFACPRKFVVQGSPFWIEQLKMKVDIDSKAVRTVSQFKKGTGCRRQIRATWDADAVELEMEAGPGTYLPSVIRRNLAGD
jgi:hypothetical protein